MKLLTIVISVLLAITTFSQNNLELLTQLKKAPRDTATVRLYLKISKSYLYTQPDSATYYVGEGSKLTKELNYKLGEGMMLSQLGTINEVHGNFSLAEKYQLEALDIFKEAKSIYSIAICKNAIGVIQAKKGNYAVATNYFLEALQLFKSINDNTGIIQSYIKLGTVNDATSNLEKALEYYNLAKDLNKNDTLSNAYYSLLNNIGIVYGRKGDLQTALTYFETGIKTSNTARFINVHIALLNNAMKVYVKLGNKQKALKYHNLAITKAREYNLPEEEARALINFADIEKENSTVALTYLNKALILSKKMGYSQIVSDVYSALVDIYKNQKKYEAALFALEQHTNIQDSLLNINKVKEMASLYASYDLNESKSRIIELKLVNQKTKLERNLFFIAVTGILLVLLIVAFFYQKTNRLNKQLKEYNIVKDKLFSIIGHDLKSPVSTLLQTLEFLENDELEPTQRQFIISELRKQTQYSLDTLNALLSWGETQLKGILINKQLFNTKNIIAKNLDLFTNQATIKSITVIDNTTDGTKVFADVNHFDFIIRNLLSNALKFTNQNGKVEINAIENFKNNTIIFSVKDNGQGISAEQHEQFLKSNMHVSYGTNKEKGTGLGLLLTKEFIKANNGKIWLESKEGEGCTFYFSLKKG